MFSVAMLMFALMCFCLPVFWLVLVPFSRFGALSGRGTVPFGLTVPVGRWLALLTAALVLGRRVSDRASERLLKARGGLLFCVRGIGVTVYSRRLKYSGSVFKTIYVRVKILTLDCLSMRGKGVFIYGYVQLGIVSFATFSWHAVRYLIQVRVFEARGALPTV